MTKKPAAKPGSLIGMAFDEALARLVRVDRKELETSYEETVQQEKEVGQYVEERRDSIRKGARRAPKRFSI